MSRRRLRGRAGTISFKSSSCFPLSSGRCADNPVMFPPGRARLATNPFPTGSASCAITMGIDVVASFVTRVGSGPEVTMTSTLRRISSLASAGRRSSFPSAYRYSRRCSSPPHIQVPVAPDVTPRCGPRQWTVRQHLGIRFGAFSFACCASAFTPHTMNATTIGKSPSHFRFLISDFGLSEEKSSPCTQDVPIIFVPNRKSAIQNLKSLITLSALARTLGGIVNPICFAALRFITSSNLVGCSTGRSAGLAPFRILST